MAKHETMFLMGADSCILDLFTGLEDLFGTAARISIEGFPSPFKIGDDLLTEILESGENIINSASVSRPDNRLSVTYQAFRAFNDQGHAVPNPNFCIFYISIQDQNRPTDEEVAKVVKTVRQFGKDNSLLPKNSLQVKGAKADPARALMSAVQASSADQISKVNQFFIRMSSEFEEQRKKLQDEFDKRDSELAERAREQERKISEEKAALEATRKEIDDRNNTHARRAIRGELIGVIKQRQENFSIPPGTSRLRLPIHVIFILIIALTGLGAVWSIVFWTANADTLNFGTVGLAVKSAIFTFGFLTSSGLYISWMNRWFDKHADAQFQTKQFEIDINRATWAVEAALEWKKIQGEEMPDALLIGVTKHLFESKSGESTEYSPMEALASSILGSASNLKLNVGGNELTLDRKSLRQIKSDA